MTARHRAALLSLIAVVVLLLSLIVPVTAFADEGTPPPESTPEETSEPESPPASDPTEAPVQPATEEPAEGPAEAPADEPSVDEPVTVPEILEQAPEGTDLVVLDDQGQTVPLVTEEAAEIVATGDPLWCPEGQAPTPGANGCSPGFTSMDDLLTYLASNEPGANGTIWIEDSYDSAVNDAGIPDFTINGSAFSTWSGYDLTIQGGWSGAYGDSTITGTSAFNAALVVSNWTGDLTLNDLILYDTDGSNSLNLQTSGNVSLDNVEAVDNQLGSGALIDTSSGAGDVTITDSSFNDNLDAGLIVDAGGSITLTDVFANDNQNWDGAELAAYGGDVTVTGGTFNLNGESGIDVYADTGDITISGLDAQQNSEDGLLLAASAGDVSVSDGVFNTNGGDGIDIGNDGYAGGGVTLQNVIATNNGGDGAAIDANGDVEASNSVFSDQWQAGYGLYVSESANITLTDLLVDWNFYGGAYLESDGTVTITGSVFNNNDSFGTFGNVHGAEIDALGNVILTDVQASGNEDSGMLIYSDGGLTVDGGTFNSNGETGLQATTLETILLTDVQANNNLENGTDLDNTGGTGDVSITDGDFSYNNEYGAAIYSAGNVGLDGVTAGGNNDLGVYIDNANFGGAGAVTIWNGVFNNNHTSVGLLALSNGDITLNDVIASFNAGGGAYLANATGSGNVTINSSAFNANEAAGFQINTAGDIDLNDVSAGANAGYGGLLDAGSDIDDSGVNSFNNNTAAGSDCFGGIQVNSVGGTSTLDACQAADTSVWFMSSGSPATYSTIAAALAAIDGGAAVDDGILHIDAALTPYLDDLSLDGADAELGQITQIAGGGSDATLIAGSLTFFDQSGGFGVEGLTFSDFLEAFDNTGALGLTDIAVAGVNTSGLNTAGIDITSQDGAVSLEDVQASGIQGGIGLYLDNSGSSVFSAVTISNSEFNGNGTDGLSVSTYGTITATDLAASFNELAGAYLYNNYGASGDAQAVDVSGGDFSYNDSGDGLDISTYGDITLFDVAASGNSDSGADLYAGGDTGMISVDQSVFDYNYDSAGLEADITGDGFFALENVSADANGGDGALLNHNGSNTSSEATISVIDSGFDWQYGDNGLEIVNTAGGEIYLQNVTGNGNYTNGASINTNGDVTVFGGVFNFSQDGDYGLEIDNSAAGDLDLTNVTAEGNAYGGVGLQNSASGVPGTVTVNGGTLNNNVSNNGLTVSNYADGEVTLTDITASNNGGSGAYVFNNGSGYTVSVDPSEFSNNAWTGLEIYSSGEILLADITANENGSSGAYLDNTAGTDGLTVSGVNTFIDNEGDGLYVFSNGDVSLNNVTASANQGYGAYVDTAGSATFSGQNVFNGNGADGVYAAAGGTLGGGSISAGGNGGSGIVAYSLSDIDLNDLTTGYNVLNGVLLANTGGAGFITVGGSNVFNGNGAWGLSAASNGDITLYDAVAGADANSGNVLAGVFLNNAGGDGDISVDGGSFAYNGAEGLYIESSGGISVYDVFAGTNDAAGVFLRNDFNPGDTVLVDTATFTGNTGDGLTILSAGDADLTDLNATGNTGEGVSVDNTAGSGAVDLAGTNLFSGNDLHGLLVISDGAISLNDVTAGGNGDGGAYLDNSTAASAQGVTLTGTNTFNGNTGDGLYVESDGDINLADVTASGNTGNGAVLVNDTVAGSGVGVDGGSFSGNTGGYGLYVLSAGSVTLSDVIAAGNAGAGASIDNSAFTGYGVTIDPSQFNGNSGDGLTISSAGEVHLTDVDANGNNGNGAVIQNNASSGYDVTVDTLVNTSSTFSGNTGGAGLYIVSAGDVTLSDVLANGNASYGAYVQNNASSGYDVTVEAVNGPGASFNGNTGGAGLYILSAGDVSLGDVTANGNNGAGAYIQNNASSGYGVTIDPGQFSGNSGDGLTIYSAGEVHLTDVDANGNTGNGAFIQNSASSGYDVTVDTLVNASSNFNGNTGGAGLYIVSAGDLTLTDVIAGGNAGTGAALVNTAGSGDVSVDPSVFDSNGGAGLSIQTLGGVTLLDVSASGNGDNGAVVLASGAVTITDGIFNSNDSTDLVVTTGGNITLTDVTASSSVIGDGAYLASGSGNVLVVCSTFENNGDYGLDVSAAGTLTLDGVTLGGNGSGDLNFSGTPIVANTSGCGAPPPPDDDGDDDDGTPPDDGPDSVIPVTGGSAALDCEQFAGTTLQLANGDSLTFLCPTQGDASAESLEAGSLPGDLPEDFTFASALNGALEGDSEPLPGRVIVSFVIPDDLADADLAILFWTGDEWLDLAEADFDDGRAVYDGGHITDDGRFDAATNFTGIFVLVEK